MLTKPTEGALRGLLLLKAHAPDTLQFLRESLEHTRMQCASVEPEVPLRRLQGQAAQLKELLDLIENAQTIAQKLK